MPSYAQLVACDPQAFVSAGQTYQRMAQGFGRVRAAFASGMAVLEGNWTGAARDAVLGRGRHLDGGLTASGQEADRTGQVLVTLGKALAAAQTSLRAAKATAMGVGLVVTPTGAVFNPNPVHNQPGNAMLGPVRGMIAAAVAAGTAADTAAAGKIAMLAGGKLISTFGSGSGGTATVVQQVASIATGQSPVDGPRTAEVIAARLAGQPGFGSLGAVDRREIDEVLGPTGVIGAAGLADWLARRDSDPAPTAD